MNLYLYGKLYKVINFLKNWYLKESVVFLFLMLNICFFRVLVFFRRVVSSVILKKYFSVGVLVIVFIFLIKFLVLRVFLFKYLRILRKERVGGKGYV